MRKLIYSFGVSLDGFIAGPGGDIGWTVPDEELHRFHNDQAREVGVYLYGRRLYEVMTYWETADQDTSADEIELEFARVWKQVPKLVFSTTLERVEGNARLAQEDVVDVARRLKAEPGKDLAVGGAGLASALMREDLIDEYQLFVKPIILGAGTPYFAPLEERIGLELAETRTFGSGVLYLRYSRA
jgi:dihydrofolate reductase